VCFESRAISALRLRLDEDHPGVDWVEKKVQAVLLYLVITCSDTKPRQKVPENNVTLLPGCLGNIMTAVAFALGEWRLFQKIQ